MNIGIQLFGTVKLKHTFSVCSVLLNKVLKLGPFTSA